MQGPWELRLLGESTVVGSDGIASNLSAKSKRFAVLVFLAVPNAGRRVRRDVLLATFWPEMDTLHARNSLRVALYQLRQTLGNVVRGSGEEELSLDSTRLSVDLWQLDAALASDDLAAWLNRPSLELVPGLHVPDASPFSEWLDTQRIALRDRVSRAAWQSANDAAAAGDLSRAVISARAATRLTREDEAGVRRLIDLLDRCGDRAGALAEFQSFEQWLRQEYEADPSPETVLLVQRVSDRTRVLANLPPPATVAAAPAVTITAGSEPPPPRKSSHRGRILVLLVGTALLVVLLALISKRDPAEATATLSLPLAVLPFVNELTDAGAAYIAPALAESITDALQSPAIVPYDVAARSDPRDRAAGIARVRSFGARAILTGTVSGQRDAIALSLTVYDAAGEAITGPVRFPGSERSLLALRDSAVAFTIRLGHVPRLNPTVRYVPAAAAYQLSLNANWLVSRRTRSELLRARALYTKALEIDPGWEDPWLGLSKANGALAYRKFSDYRPTLVAAEFAANEALKRAPNDGRGLIERAMARFQLGNFGGAEADARRATAGDTTDWHMQSLIGTWWQWSGSHLDSALRYTRRAQRLAPWDRQVALNLLQIVGCLSDSVAILQQARRVLDMDPSDAEALETLAWTLTRFGNWDQATEAYERRYTSFVDSGVTAAADRLRGEARFRAVVLAVRRAVYDARRWTPSPTPPLLEDRVALFEDLGMRDSSLAAFASVVDSLDVHHTNMMCAPNLRGFRRDPRTREIVRRRGWPPAEFVSLP